MFFFFKQKTAYEMRISDWSSDVCSSDLPQIPFTRPGVDRVSGADKVEVGIAAHDIPLVRKVGDATRRAKATISVEGRRGIEDAVARLIEGWRVDRVFKRSAAVRPVTLQIGRAHVWTPVTNAHLVCRLLLEKKKKI